MRARRGCLWRSPRLLRSPVRQFQEAEVSTLRASHAHTAGLNSQVRQPALASGELCRTKSLKRRGTGQAWQYCIEILPPSYFFLFTSARIYICTGWTVLERLCRFDWFKAGTERIQNERAEQGCGSFACEGMPSGRHSLEDW